MIEQSWYGVEEGMRNPREPEVVAFRPWGAYATKEEALVEYRKLPIARLTYVQVIRTKVA